MDRLSHVLLAFVVVCLVGLGVEQAVIASRQHDEDVRQACIARVQAVGTLTLMVPADAADPTGRIQSAQELSSRLDDC